MKKLLMVTGGVALVLIAVVAATLIVVVIDGRKLDRESKQYTDSAIMAIASNWDERALRTRASPELLKAIARR